MVHVLLSGGLDHLNQPTAVAIPGRRTSSADASPASTSPDAGTAHDAEYVARRLEKLTADIGARLQMVCSHLSDAEFAQLVRDIASVTLKFEEREHGVEIDAKDLPRRAD
jgi:hypothetical protein